mgnify:CR=1 FL=1
MDILNIFHDGSTILEISSIPLMEKIHKDYPNYYFMFSKQADLISEFTPEILNEIFDNDQRVIHYIHKALGYSMKKKRKI